MTVGVLFFVNGQDLVSKKGFTILPEAGDISIGFDAVPVVDFFLNVSNIMVNTGQTAAHPSYVTGFNNVIVGKYFLDETKAFRGKFGFNTVSVRNTDVFFNPDDVANIADPDKWTYLEDVQKISGTDILFAGGLEFRRGHNRVQGFYGGELLLGFSGGKTVNTWGVELNNANLTNGYANGDGSPLTPRVLKDKDGFGMEIGLRGFAGVEYFFAPKISIGAEFGWGFGFVSEGRSSITTEVWDPVSTSAKERVVEGDSQGGFGFGVDDGIGKVGAGIGLAPSAALMINFHF